MGYDTIKLRIDSRSISKIEVEKFISSLSDVETEIKKSGCIILHGYTGGNMRVDVYPSAIVIQGSLHKFYKGNNVEDFTLPEVRIALEMLKANVGGIITGAVCTRLDYGKCYVLENSIEQYLLRLLKCGCYKRSEKVGSVYYELKGGQRTLKFYDKWREIKDKRLPVDESLAKYQGSNLLRYEISFLKQAGRQLKGKGEVLSLSDIVTQSFFNQIENRFKAEFDAIHKSQLFEFE